MRAASSRRYKIQWVLQLAIIEINEYLNVTELAWHKDSMAVCVMRSANVETSAPFAKPFSHQHVLSQMLNKNLFSNIYRCYPRFFVSFRFGCSRKREKDEVFINVGLSMQTDWIPNIITNAFANKSNKRKSQVFPATMK